MAKHLEYEVEEEGGREKPKTFEDILEQIGGFGRFQALLLLFVLFYEIPAGFLAFAPVFVGGVPSEWYCLQEGENGVENSTKMTAAEVCTKCQNGTRTAPPYTIVAEWDLICSKSWASAAITTVQMSGMFFGNIFPPQISDWYGRKITFLLLMILMALGESVSAVAEDPYTFAAARFICGIGLAGYFSLNGIYTMEFLTPKWRQLGGCLGPLGEGLILLGILAYLIRPWRLLLWATTFPFVTVFFVFPFLPESPRWLLRQGRTEEAESVLKYIARINGKRFHSDASLLLKEISDTEKQALEGTLAPTKGTKGPSNGRYTYLDLFKRRALRRKTLLFVGIWFCWAFTYFGLSYNIRNFGVDPYLLTVLMGVADAVGFRAALLVNNRLGRRKALVAFTSISACFFLPVALVQILIKEKSPDLQTYFLIPAVLLGKMCVAGSRSAVRVFTVESYPVAIRTMGFGVSRVAATFGGIAAPQIAYLGSKWPSVPLLAFSILGFLGSLLSLLLKETGGQPLEDELNEEEKTKKVTALKTPKANKIHPTLNTKKEKAKGKKKQTKAKRKKKIRSNSI